MTTFVLQFSLEYTRHRIINCQTIFGRSRGLTFENLKIVGFFLIRIFLNKNIVFFACLSCFPYSNFKYTNAIKKSSKLDTINWWFDNKAPSGLVVKFNYLVLSGLQI